MKKVDPASFRDPSGFVFMRNGVIYRQVNECYRQDYDLLMGSGLYDELIGAGLMVPHDESAAQDTGYKPYRILKPAPIPFISYPHEWCFSQLQDAALLTLDIQKRALKHGMSLKDASAFNAQFKDGKPIFIDSLSFERYREGKPWVGYRQFCMHFLAPLALMSCCDVRLNEWFRISVNGVPLDLASSLLPFKSKLNPALLMHIHMHAKSEKRYGDKGRDDGKHNAKLSKFALLGLIDSLEGAVRKLGWKPVGTEWADYYQDTNYSNEGLNKKHELVVDYLTRTQAKTVWDLGANDGTFSRISSSRGINTIAFDIDPACVEKNYRAVRSGCEKNLLPLLQDLTNPSPGLGWNGRERSSLAARGPCDTALALALIHHLAISNNVPLSLIAEQFAGLCNWLIIEFVPKEDSQVQRLLATRQDIFDKYDQENFETEFGRFFSIIEKSQIKDSSRVLFLLEKI